MLLSGRVLAYHARVLRQFLILEAKKEKGKEKEKVFVDYCQEYCCYI